MKTFFITCATIFVVLLLVLVVLLVCRIFAKKSSSKDLIYGLSLIVGLLMIIDVIVLILGGLWITGEKTSFTNFLVILTLGFMLGFLKR